MSQIKKKFLENNAVDGTKLLLENEQPIRAKDSLGAEVEVVKINTDDHIEFPQVPYAVDKRLATEEYVDTAIAAIPPLEWGQISGTLSDQTDLQSALNSKANQATTYTKTEVDTLLDDKADLADLANYIEKPVGPTDGQVLTYDSGSGEWVAETPVAAPVVSVNGQTGAVVLDAADIAYDNSGSSLLADDTQEAIDELANMIATLPDPITYKGSYNATTNTPTLSDSDTNVEGFLYRVTVAGTQNFGSGPISFEVGDSVVNNGMTWEKWDHSDQVLSVNGQTGAVVLTTTDISEGTNLYFTDTRAKTAAVVNSMAGTETDQAPSVSSVKTYVSTELADYLKLDGSTPMEGNLNLDNNNINNVNEVNSVYGNFSGIKTGIISDVGGDEKIDVNTSVLKDDSGNPAINFSTRELISTTGVSVDFQTRELKSSTGTVVDFESRELKHGGNTIVSWGTGVVDVNGSKITDLADGVIATDAVTKGQLDALGIYKSSSVTLTSSNITNKHFVMSEKYIESSLTIYVVGGTVSVRNVDYTVNNAGATTLIDFNGTSLDGLLEENDVLVITGNYIV